ncbi:MAG: glycosyltransferase family 4 protein [Acidobacteriota bacterium]|nr:glycosyltransferase family 4 protein [Acidobacteriota bacterium]
MKVLALSSYPIETASTRYRVAQFVKPLSEQGIILTILPFFDSQLQASIYKRAEWPRTALRIARATLRRVREVWRAHEADVLFVQREAMIFGPPVLEWLAVRVLRRPMVLDLDDATYVPYTSPTYGRLGKALKWTGKTDKLIRWASVVTCGNRNIAEYVSSKGATARIIPTVVNTEVFRPVPKLQNRQPVLGWIGTHSTFPYLQSIFPVLQHLAATHRFKLKIVGAGVEEVKVLGLEVENLKWKLEREVEDFQSIDVGLYPVNPEFYAENWAGGKSGFKAIQYMAVGIPYVASPVGAIEDIGEHGITYFQARTDEEWLDALGKLLSDSKLRSTMGAAGRSHVVKHYCLSEQTKKLAVVLREAMQMGT